MLDSTAYDSKSGNPFSDRPPSSRRNEEAQRALDAAVAELDSNAPENFDENVWERLCSYRRAKIEMEMNVSYIVCLRHSGTVGWVKQGPLKMAVSARQQAVKEVR